MLSHCIHVETKHVTGVLHLLCLVFNSGDSLSLNPLHQRDSRRGELSFTWEPLIIMDCPSLRYNITASEGCGACPNSVLDNGITCTNVQRGKSCTLSVFVNLCSDLIRSDPITVSTGKGVYL